MHATLIPSTAPLYSMIAAKGVSLSQVERVAALLLSALPDDWQAEGFGEVDRREQCPTEPSPAVEVIEAA